MVKSSQLIPQIAHDLRNYIGGISGLADIILDGKSEQQIAASEDLQFTKIIHSQAIEMLYFVEDLLDVSQVEIGEFKLGFLDECDVGELVKRIVLLNKGLAISNQICVKTDIANSLPKLKTDVRRLKQILNNLITNAIKYSQEGKQISIKITKTNHSLSAQKHTIQIEISDSGIGMTEEEIAMAFSGEGKNISKSDLNKTVDSHGLGLPIVKKLVELLNGEIKIESEKSKGTKVFLEF